MEPGSELMNLRTVFKTLCYTALFNTIIAVFLTSLKFGGVIFINFVFSQCIGFSICSCILIVHDYLGAVKPLIQLLFIVSAITIGSVIGTLLAFAATGISASILLEKDPPFIHIVFLGILFGSIISYFFFSRHQISAAKIRIQEERMKNLAGEKEKAEANLRLLQAQIEPHFLFNTLSNILSLIDTDLDKGKSMLVDLIHYLRTSLSKTRAETNTIAQEMEMIHAYINIFKIRMGDRLRFGTDIPDSVKDFPFPPMLVQPLVENAIKHGLEPRIEGGEISISAKQNGDVIRLEIADTGLGFHEGSDLGVGLTNIRERLQSLYGDNARLILEENQPSGLKAVIEVPNVTDKGDNSG